MIFIYIYNIYTDNICLYPLITTFDTVIPVVNDCISNYPKESFLKPVGGLKYPVQSRGEFIRI